MRIPEALSLLKASGLDYICYEGYEKCTPGSEPDVLKLICIEPRRIIEMLSLTALSPGTVHKDAIYYMEDSLSKATCRFHLYTKGKSVFPEQFESELLISRVIKNETIHCPDDERAFWVALFTQVIHYGNFDTNFREKALNKIVGRIGYPMRSPYTSLKCYTDVNVIKNAN